MRTEATSTHAQISWQASLISSTLLHTMTKAPFQLFISQTIDCINVKICRWFITTMPARIKRVLCSSKRYSISCFNVCFVRPKLQAATLHGVASKTFRLASAYIFHRCCQIKLTSGILREMQDSSFRRGDLPTRL